MILRHAIVAVLTLAAVANPARASDPYELLLDGCRPLKFVVLGRITRVHSCEHPQWIPGVRTRATATLQVTCHLKGFPDLKTLEVEFLLPSDIKKLKPQS